MKLYKKLFIYVISNFLWPALCGFPHNSNAVNSLKSDYLCKDDAHPSQYLYIFCSNPAQYIYIWSVHIYFLVCWYKEHFRNLSDKPHLSAPHVWAHFENKRMVAVWIVTLKVTEAERCHKEAKYYENEIYLCNCCMYNTQVLQ